jgi:hypothetical protein
MAVLEMEDQEGRLWWSVLFLQPFFSRWFWHTEEAPCRCQIHLEGLEWFLYNRTPSFDAIVERMQEAERKAQASASGKAASTDGSSEDHVDAGEGSQAANGTSEVSGKRSTDRAEETEGM